MIDAVLTIPMRASLSFEGVKALVAPLGLHAERASKQFASMARAAPPGKHNDPSHR